MIVVANPIRNKSMNNNNKKEKKRVKIPSRISVVPSFFVKLAV